MVIPAALAALENSITEPLNDAPAAPAAWKADVVFSAADATAPNIVPSTGIKLSVPAAASRLSPTLANWLIVLVILSLNLPTMLPANSSFLPTAPAASPSFPSLLVPPAPPPPSPPPPPPPPSVISLPPSRLRSNFFIILRISLSVCSEAAFLASTSPIIGMLTITGCAIRYYFPEKMRI